MLPTLWARNTWSWRPGAERPSLRAGGPGRGVGAIEARPRRSLGTALALRATASPRCSSPRTRRTRSACTDVADAEPYVKDAFNDYVVDGPQGRREPGPGRDEGRRRVCADHRPGETASVAAAPRATRRSPTSRFGREFEAIFARRVAEADEFYDTVVPGRADRRRAARDAAGLRGALLVEAVLPLRRAALARRRSRRARRPRPSGCDGPQRRVERTRTTRTSSRCPTRGSTPGTRRGTSPSTCIPFALVDPDFAKEQLVLFLREWYMHPNGQIPAYEFAFGDVNPPVHAWAGLARLQDERRARRCATAPSSAVFQKLIINFTWWVNRKDAEGNNLFPGGLPGPRQHRRLRPLEAAARPAGTSSRPTARLDGQFYASTMMSIALELARRQPRQRGRGQQVLRALRADRPRHEHLGGEGLRSGTRRTASTTTAAHGRPARAA